MLIPPLFLFYQKKYRQQPCNFKHTSVVDSPDIVHARLSGQITNEVREREPAALSEKQKKRFDLKHGPLPSHCSVCTKRKG